MVHIYDFLFLRWCLKWGVKNTRTLVFSLGYLNQNFEEKNVNINLASLQEHDLPNKSSRRWWCFHRVDGHEEGWEAVLQSIHVWGLHLLMTRGGTEDLNIGTEII